MGKANMPFFGTGSSKAEQDDVDSEIFQEVGVNILSAMLLVLAADATVQLLHDRCNVCSPLARRHWVYDYRRTGQTVLVGVVMACLNNMWYHALDSFYETTSLKDVAAKVILDTVVLIPVVITFYVFAMGLLENKRLNRVYAEWEFRFTDIYMTSLMAFPAAQVINFIFVPVDMRMLYVNACYFAWHMYLSHSRNEKSSLTIGESSNSFSTIRQDGSVQTNSYFPNMFRYSVGSPSVETAL